MVPEAAPIRAIPLRPRGPLRRDRMPLFQRGVQALVRAARAHPHSAAIIAVAVLSGGLVRVVDSTATAGPREQPAAGPAAANVAVPRASASSHAVGQAAAVPTLGLALRAAGAVAGDPVGHLAGAATPADARERAASADEEVVSRSVNALIGEPNLVSSSVLIVDQQSGRLLYAKNDRDVLPIASITKLMTALVVLESGAPMHEVIEITEDDRDQLKASSSRLRIGAQLSRETLLELALMASENRAASALARAHPGGKPAFVAAMNRRAAALGMRDTHFGDPTGLDKTNVSTAADLVRLVQADWHNPTIRVFSTSSSRDVAVGRQTLRFNNTNPLLRTPHPDWQISLSKTGFIEEAGHCLVMRATVAERDVVIVLLNAQGKLTRIGDANRIRRWMEAQPTLRREQLG